MTDIIVDKQEKPVTFVCCFCGKQFEGYGHSPYPLGDYKKDRCCDDCNYNIVLTERIRRIYD